jgi:chemotaxis protein MotB
MQLTGEKAVLAQQLAEAVQARDARTRDVADRDQRIAALEQDFAETQQSGGQAREEADQLTYQVQELTAARADLNQQLAQATQARNQAAQELRSRAERLAALERDATAVQQELKERSAKIERLTSELRSTTEVRDKLETYAVDRTKLLEQADRDVRAGADRIEALEQQLDELRNTNAAAQSELAKRGAERANSESRLAELTSSFDAASAEAVRQKTAADEARRRYEKLDAQVTAIEPYRLAFVNEARVLLDGQAGVTVAEDRIILETDDLYVGRATLRLTDDGRRRLRAIAQALAAGIQQMPAELPWLLRVEGHTDDIPLTNRSIFDTNWALSTARAATAAEYLTRQGIPGEHVSAVGMSQYRPLVTEQTPEAKRQNRRLEITLVAQR